MPISCNISFSKKGVNVESFECRFCQMKVLSNKRSDCRKWNIYFRSITSQPPEGLKMLILQTWVFVSVFCSKVHRADKLQKQHRICLLATRTRFFYENKFIRSEPGFSAKNQEQIKNKSRLIFSCGFASI